MGKADSNLVEELFHGAVDLSAEERQRFLSSECGENHELRAEVETLLEAYDRAPTYLDRPLVKGALADDLKAPAVPSEGETIGPYRLEELVGEGGMGRVFLAEQSSPIRRQVALKLMNATTVSERMFRRFEAERQALALMSHPNIARVFDAGTSERGEPWVAMEYVPGLPLTRYSDDRRLSIRERLELFLEVCSGVQHAHQKGVIHRDLKPSNVLVTSVDEVATPKIIDFGIAKTLDEPLTQDTLVTGDRIMGTPAYMSPERFRGGDDVDTRADVYSLGVMLYELLVGELPFQWDGASLVEVASQIDTLDALRPSTKVTTLSADRLAAVADERSTDPSSLNRRLRGDLDWITLRAMDKDRDRRYPSAAELAADVRRHLNHEPVEAGPPSAGYRMRKFVRRHTVGVAASILVLLALVGGIVATTLQAQRANREAERANLEAERANREAASALQTTEFLVELFEVSNPEEGRGETITAREILDRGAGRIDSELVDQPLIQARLLHTIGRVYWSLGLLDQAETKLEEALAIRAERPGETSADYASTADMLAIIYGRQGRQEEAEELHLRAIAIWQGAGSDDRLPDALQHLGVVYRSQGRFEESEKYYLDAIARLDEQGPSKSLAVALDNLAGLYNEIGRLEEVLPLMRRSVAILEEVVDPEHPLLATHRSKLAIALYTAGNLDEALDVSRDSLRVIEKIYAPDHPQVAYQLYVYGGLNRVAERFEEAEAALARSAEIYAVSQRQDNPWLSRALGELAQVQVGLGKHEAAEESARRALAATRAKANANPIDIAETELSTAAVLQATGTLDEALALAENARSTFEEQLGADSISVALAKDLLGDIHAKMGQPAVAEQLYRQALAGAAAVIGSDNPALALVIDDLVLVLRAQGREAEAADFEQRARSLRGEQPAASTQQSTGG